LLIFSNRIFNRFCPKEWPFRPSYTRNDNGLLEQKICQAFLYAHSIPPIAIGLQNLLLNGGERRPSSAMASFTGRPSFPGLSPFSKINRNALAISRQLKPEIPLIGAHGIPLRDEIELEMILGN
jgi:hypothetical protein